MLNWTEARSIALARTPTLARRRVRLEEAAGRFLAEPLTARSDWPSFDMSAVDGFAVFPDEVAAASKHHPVQLELAGTVHAGGPADVELRRGTTIKLMTGACVPGGAGAIVKREHCREEPTAIGVCRAVTAGENIRPRGGEFRKGETILSPRVRIAPPIAGLLAMFGYVRVWVYDRPAVGIIVTGDELLPISQALRPGKIRDSNSYALAAAVQGLGIEKRKTLRLADRPAVLKKHFAAALKRFDVLLTVGGVSVGDHDYVRQIMAELGAKEQFWGIAVKPGKPAYFGLYARPRHRPCAVFGLPGNPVSAMVCFHQLVKPALLKMMGALPAGPQEWRARLVGELHKRPSRLEWVRGFLSTEGDVVTVKPVAGQESHMLGGLAQANCLIQFPQGAEFLADDSQVIVEPLVWLE